VVGQCGRWEGSEEGEKVRWTVLDEAVRGGGVLRGVEEAAALAPAPEVVGHGVDSEGGHEAEDGHVEPVPYQLESAHPKPDVVLHPEHPVVHIHVLLQGSKQPP
jgi:hypothetical protein